MFVKIHLQSSESNTTVAWLRLLCFMNSFIRHQTKHSELRIQQIPTEEFWQIPDGWEVSYFTEGIHMAHGVIFHCWDRIWNYVNTLCHLPPLEVILDLSDIGQRETNWHIMETFLNYKKVELETSRMIYFQVMV